MNKKILSRLTLFVLAVLLMITSACYAPGMSNTGTTTASQATTAAPTTAAPTTATPTEASLFKDHDTIIYYIFGTEYADAPKVYAEANKILKEKLNTTVDFRVIPSDNYNILISSGEEYDLIGIADWMGFWDFATNGAFAEVSDELIQKYMPEFAKELDNYYDLNKVDGKRYAIPLMGQNVYNNVFLARGDLMDKYGLTTLDGLDNLEAYVFAVAENEKNIIAYDLPGSRSYKNPAVYVAYQGWQTPGSPNATLPVVLNVVKGEYTLFNLYEQPETLEFMKRMKIWKEKGVWSQDALFKKENETNSFKNGTSALCTNNLDGANKIYKEFQADDRKAWDIRMFMQCPVFNAKNSNNGTGTAVGSNSKKVERALAVLDLLKSDTTLNRLMMHGIEGEHYEPIDSHYLLPLSDRYGWTGNGLDNYDTFLFVGGGFPDSGTMLDALIKKVLPNKLVDYKINNANVSVEAAAISEVYSQYAAPLWMGFSDDVEADLEIVKKKLKDAGIDKYMAEIQKQVNDYLAAH